jgi:uncharacterized UPF0146 family protein
MFKDLWSLEECAMFQIQVHKDVSCMQRIKAALIHRLMHNAEVSGKIDGYARAISRPRLELFVGAELIYNLQSPRFLNTATRRDEAQARKGMV